MTAVETWVPLTASSGKAVEALTLTPFSDRVASLGRPLRTAFIVTSLPVGGAETLLMNLARRFRPDRIEPWILCTKDPGPLGQLLASELPISSRWLRHKFDATVVVRMAMFLRRHGFHALVTVGAGDKMFWGRIAAQCARLPVVCSALHSTGWPDGVGLMNRMLSPVTDRFIAVANAHRTFLIESMGLSEKKVSVIPNGVNTDRFRPDPDARDSVLQELGLSDNTRLVGIVAALRPEKNHLLFVEVADRVRRTHPSTRFLIIGDGPERSAIEAKIREFGLTRHVFMLGTRSDIPRLMASLNVFVLTSLNEASPVSILEASSCGVPVVASRVGSVCETVQDGVNGFTVPPSDADTFALRIRDLLVSKTLADSFAENGREIVKQEYSLDAMVLAYEELIASIYWSKLPSRVIKSVPDTVGSSGP